MRHVFTFLISALYISVTFAQEINVQINNGHGYVANQMEVSPNGKYLLTTSGEECILWDLASSKVIGVRTDKKKFKNVLFSADGQNIITNAQKDNIIKV